MHSEIDLILQKLRENPKVNSWECEVSFTENGQTLRAKYTIERLTAETVKFAPETKCESVTASSIATSVLSPRPRGRPRKIHPAPTQATAEPPQVAPEASQDVRGAPVATPAQEPAPEAATTPFPETLGYLKREGAVTKAITEPMAAEDILPGDDITGLLKILKIELRPRSKPSPEMGITYFAMQTEGAIKGEVFSLLPDTTPFKEGEVYKVLIAGRKRTQAGPAPFIAQIIEHIPNVSGEPSDDQVE